MIPKWEQLVGKSEVTKARIDTLHIVKRVLTGSDDFKIEPALQSKLTIGQVTDIRLILKELEQSFRDQEGIGRK